MNSDKKLTARRKLLVSLTVGGGAWTIPDTWTKAVFNAVVLPAHAQSSKTDT